MRKIVTFVKDNIVVGIVVLVPIAVVAVVLSGTLKKLVKAATPVTDNISIGGPLIKTAIAIVLVILLLGVVFFISGIFLKTYLGNSFKNWLEKKVLYHVPFFEIIKNITSQFAGVEKNNYTVVEVRLNESSGVILGLLTETLTDERCVVYCPFSPLINVGQIHIIAKENVKRLELSFKDFTDIITKIGLESDKIQKKMNKLKKS